MTINDCRIIELPKFLDARGNLSFAENFTQIPFEVKRTYWLYDVPGGENRGGHAEINNEELVIALSGAFVAQSQGYADVGMGQGTIVIGLASIIIGEVVFGNRFNFAYKLGAVVGGSVIYRIIIAVVLQLGMKSTDLKLFTAIIVAVALAIPVITKKSKVKGV